MPSASQILREKFKQADDIRDAGLTTPEGIERWDDIVYGTDRVWQSLDVYRPRSMAGQKLPVIVSVHGGGWVYGDKQRYQYYCMDLSQRGFAVVNFSYRLAPENKFPASMEDVNAVFRWTLDHAEEYGFDARRIYAVGDSAGAHQLALYCCICADPTYAAKYPFCTPAGFLPAAVALNCGAYGMSGPSAEARSPLMAEYLPGGGTEEELALIDVLRHIPEGFPPVFIMTAMGDFLKDQARELAAVLAEKQTPFMYRLYGSKAEPLGHVFHCDIRSRAAKLCNDETCAFFSRILPE